MGYAGPQSAFTIPDYKDSVRLATTAPLPAVTAAGSGIGKTLTADAVGALIVDTIAVALNDRILVKNQVTGANNGIYTVTTLGTGAVAFVLTRAPDFDEDAEITADAVVPVEEGTANADQLWQLTTNEPITLETTTLVWSLGPAGFVPVTRTLTAGAGLTGGGNLSADRTFDVAANADGSIIVNANDVQLGRVAGATAPVSGATAAIYGIVRLTPAPAVADTPIAVGSNRSIATSGGLSGGGDMTADRTLSVNEAFAFTWDADHQHAKTGTATSAATQVRSFRSRYTASMWTGAAEAERDWDVYAAPTTVASDESAGALTALRFDLEGNSILELLPTVASGVGSRVIFRNPAVADGTTANFTFRVATAYGHTDKVMAWQESDGTEILWLGGSGAVFAGTIDNTPGVPQYSFRSETGLGIVRGAAGEVAITDATRIFLRSNATRTELYSDAAGALGYALELYHDSASPLAADVLARQSVFGRSSTAVKREYGRIDWVNVDPTNTTEDGRYDLSAMVAGALTTGFSVGSTGTAMGLGFFGVTVAARAAAYVQTFATADRTHAAFTSADLAAFTGGAVGFLDATERDNVRTQFNALRADVDDVKRLCNSIIDDLQAYGLFQ